MGELKFKIKDETEKAFRKAAMHEFGFQKGSLSTAADQALSRWTNKHEELDKLRKMAKERIKDPVKSMRGILKHVKNSSVELQHEVSKSRSSRWKSHAN